jgi:dihydrofolate reductase
MRKLSVFNFITLNGFYKGLNEDISWHRHGGEEAAFAAEGANSRSTLVFGRVTYEMMAGYWPTPLATESMPEVAKGMNESEKVVFSNTLKSPSWSNTRIINGNIVEEMKKLKKGSGSDLTILGSGSIVSLFAENGLIDDYQLMIDPVALGSGTSVFNGLTRNLDLKLKESRAFKSGVVLLWYQKG